MEVVIFPSVLVLSTIGIYLNLCYQRATFRSTVYTRFLGRNLRFLSVAQLALAFSNMVFTVAMWGSQSSRSRKSETFFSMALSMTRAVPATTVFWVTVERLMFNRLPKLRDNQKFRYVAIYRMIEIVVSVLVELGIRVIYQPIPDQSQNSTNAEEFYAKSTLLENTYYDYYHFALFIISLVIALPIYYAVRGSHARAGLLGGIRNDQKIQTLKSQIVFFKRSWLPLYVGCLSDLAMQVVMKRFVVIGDASLEDMIYLLLRCYLPIIYPISLISCHKSLRLDYLANIILCRKARNLHKESKVKVIATKESQESIIANLKMIGILSDVDTNQAAAAAAAAQMMPHGGRISISKDPISNTSIGSLQKNSTVMGPPAGNMMFHTRPKMSVPSMGSVG